MNTLVNFQRAEPRFDGQFSTSGNTDGLLLLAAEKMRPQIAQMLDERGRGRPSREMSIVVDLLAGPLSDVVDK